MSRAAPLLLVLVLAGCKPSESGGPPSPLPSSSALPAPAPCAPPAPDSPPVVASSSAATPAVDAAAPAVATSAIAWQLTVEPALTFKMSDLPRFKIWIVVTNHSTRPVDTKRDDLELRVNGATSMAFGMAFGNGVRTGEWEALAPGATLREARGLGDALFPSPGTYRLDLEQAGVRVAKLEIRVLP